jgi:hypothetical protein
VRTPGVGEWTRTRYCHRIYLAAAALRALLDRAYQAALDELASISEEGRKLCVTKRKLSEQAASRARTIDGQSGSST